MEVLWYAVLTLTTTINIILLINSINVAMLKMEFILLYKIITRTTAIKDVIELQGKNRSNAVVEFSMIQKFNLAAIISSTITKLKDAVITHSSILPHIHAFKMYFIQNC